MCPKAIFGPQSVVRIAERWCAECRAGHLPRLKFVQTGTGQLREHSSGNVLTRVPQSLRRRNRTRPAKAHNTQDRPDSTHASCQPADADLTGGATTGHRKRERKPAVHAQRPEQQQGQQSNGADDKSGRKSENESPAGKEYGDCQTSGQATDGSVESARHCGSQPRAKPPPRRSNSRGMFLSIAERWKWDFRRRFRSCEGVFCLHADRYTVCWRSVTARSMTSSSRAGCGALAGGTGVRVRVAVAGLVGVAAATAATSMASLVTETG